MSVRSLLHSLRAAKSAGLFMLALTACSTGSVNGTLGAQDPAVGSEGGACVRRARLRSGSRLWRST